MDKQKAPSGWMMRFELVFITNSPGAEDGTCPPAGGRVATRCMMRRGNSRGQALTATGSHSLPALQVQLDKQKTIRLDGFLFWCGRRDLPACGRSSGGELRFATRKNSPPDCFLTRTLQVPFQSNQKIQAPPCG